LFLEPFTLRTIFCTIPSSTLYLAAINKLSFGTDNVKYFDAEVSPYAGFAEDYTNGFNELYELLPPRSGAGLPTCAVLLLAFQNQ